MKEFGIATGKSKEELLNTMSAAMIDGWEPVGGLATFGLELCIGVMREARPKKLVDEQGVELGEMVISDVRAPIELGEFKYQVIKVDNATAVLRKIPNVEIKVVELAANETAAATTTAVSTDAAPAVEAPVAEVAAPAAAGTAVEEKPAGEAITA